MNRTQTALITAFFALGAVSCGGPSYSETGASSLTEQVVDVDVARDDGVLHLRAFASGRSDFAFQGPTGAWHEGAVEVVDAFGEALTLDDTQVVAAMGRQLHAALLEADAVLLKATPLSVTLPGDSAGTRQQAFVRAIISSANPLNAEPHKAKGTKGAEPHDEGDAEPHDEDDDEAEPHLTAEPHGPTMKLL